MKIYALGGLGADERTFTYISTTHEFVALEWEKPMENESIKSYAARLESQIDKSEEFSLLGVSFGGMVMTELALLLKPKNLFLVSSVQTKSELRSTYKFAGKLGLDKLVPFDFLLKNAHLIKFLFGVKNQRDKELIKDILEDTDPEFVKWAIRAILTWKNSDEYSGTKRIHGGKDRVLPVIKDEVDFLFKNQGHFIIVEEAEKISEILNSHG